MVDDIQAAVSDRIERAIEDRWCSAASAVVLHHGRTLARHGAGWLATTAADPAGDSPTGVPVAHPEPAGASTWFDLASVTKVFSTVTLMTLVEHGELDLDEPLAHHLPSFASGDRAQVTLRMLLTHTAGLPATWTGWFAALDRARHLGPDPLQAWPAAAASRAELLADLVTVPLENRPGTVWNYSCVGFDTAMVLAETLTGRDWEDLVNDLVLAPMGLQSGVAFHPSGPVAATEYQPEYGRGVIQGIVHDETAWALGGTAANAGLFATVDALGQFAEALRTDTLPCSNAPLLANALPTVLGREVADPIEAPWGHSLGLRIGQDWLGSPAALGHSGFTGTGIMINPEYGLTVAVLANRVHPRRSDMQVHRLREEICRAATLAVRG